MLTPRVALAASTLLLALACGSCDDDDVGAPCDRDITAPDEARHADDESLLIDYQALACRSRLCIRVTPDTRPLCTAPCTTEADCPARTATCPGGFACRHGQSVGGLRCCRLCVCRDLLADPQRDPLEASCAGVAASCPNL